MGGIAIRDGKIVYYQPAGLIAYGLCCVRAPYRLRLVGDEGVTPCEECDNWSGNPWNNEFYLYYNNRPQYVEYADVYASSYKGKYIVTCGMHLTYTCESNTWTLTLKCIKPSFECVKIWEGTKTGGDPVGIYTRTGGCDDTDTLSIEEVEEGL